MLFSDRKDAGRRIAARFLNISLQDPVVIALQPGGVPVALEVAKALGAPIDVMLAARLPEPFEPDRAAGIVLAIAEAEVFVDTAASAGAGTAGLRDEGLSAETQRQGRRLVELRRQLLAGAASPRLDGRDVLLIGDGTEHEDVMRGALVYLRRRYVRRLYLGLPMAPRQLLRRLDVEGEVARVVCLEPYETCSNVLLYYDRGAAESTGDLTRLLRLGNDRTPTRVSSQWGAGRWPAPRRASDRAVSRRLAGHDKIQRTRGRV